MDELDEKIKEEINANWLEIIHKVNLHEKECKENLIKIQIKLKSHQQLLQPGTSNNINSLE